MSSEQPSSNHAHFFKNIGFTSHPLASHGFVQTTIPAAAVSLLEEPAGSPTGVARMSPWPPNPGRRSAQSSCRLKSPTCSALMALSLSCPHGRMSTQGGCGVFDCKLVGRRLGGNGASSAPLLSARYGDGNAGMEDHGVAVSYRQGVSSSRCSLVMRTLVMTARKTLYSIRGIR